MKKSNFTQFVQEGRLIEFQFEPQLMREVLNEILQLLSKTDQRFSKIEDQLPLFAKKGVIDDLLDENKEIKAKMENLQNDYETKMSNFEEKLKKKLKKMRAFVEDSNSILIVDVRRHVSTQIQDVMNMINRQDEERNVIDRNKMEQELNQLKQVVQKTVQDLDDAKKLSEKTVTIDMLREELDPMLKDLELKNVQLNSVMGIPSKEENISLNEAKGKEADVEKKPRVQISLGDAAKDTNNNESQSKKLALTQKANIQKSFMSTPNLQTSIFDEIQGLERQVRRLNEIANGYKLSMEDLNQQILQHETKMKEIISQGNVKHIQNVQEIDQLRNKVERMREEMQVIVGHAFPNDQEQLLNNYDDNRTTNASEGNKSKSGFRFADRALPPLQNQYDNFEVTDGSSQYNSTATPSPGQISKQNSNGSEFFSPLATENNSARGKASSKLSKDLNVKILKAPYSNKRNFQSESSASTTTASQVMNAPIYTIDDIQEKVDIAIKSSISGFLERSKAESVKEVEKALKIVDQVTSKIDQKIDREFVERLFNKFRVVISDLKDKIDQIQSTFLGWVTRDELQQVLEKFIEQLQEVKDTAGGSSKYRCLLCGRPRTHISGMIVGDALNSYENDDDNDNYENEPIPKNYKKISSRVQTPTTPKRPRDVIQLLTTTEEKK